MNRAKNQQAYQGQQDAQKKGQIVAGPIGSTLEPELNGSFMSSASEILDRQVPRFKSALLSGFNNIKQKIPKLPKVSLGTKVAPPTPTATPTPTPQMKKEPYYHNIQIPASSGVGTTRVPGNQAQALMEGFDKYGEATNAAQVLHHPYSQTYTPKEIVKYGKENWNRGENPTFSSTAENANGGGSLDRGLTQVNSSTFNGLMKRHPDWMAEIGVTNWEQMKDPTLNAKVSSLILLDSNYDAKTKSIKKNPNYMRWFAAPLPLRTR